jgi:hypothetical protein
MPQQILKGDSMTIIIKRTLAVAAMATMLAGGFVIGHATADQPHMRNALDALRNARAELYAAAADKGGHRMAAINYVDRAIAEARAGIDYAR